MKVLDNNFLEVLKNEGVVSIVTMNETEPHIANTWNSFVQISKEGSILIPAAGMQATEKNVGLNNKIKIALGSKEVVGFNNYQGCGFLIEGTASFVDSGANFDFMKEKFSFISRVLEVEIKSITQKI